MDQTNEFSSESERVIKQALRLSHIPTEHELALTKIRRSLSTRHWQNGEPLGALDTVLKDHQRLLSLESPANKFVIAAKGDVDMASFRLAKYWKRRQQDFQNDKCFLPLVATTKGALTKADKEVYMSGFFVNLPEDEQNRSVICMDRGLLQKDFSQDLSELLPCAIRCAWYVMSKASGHPNVSKKGVVLLVNHQQGDHIAFDTLFQRSLYDLADGFPFASFETVVVSKSTDDAVSLSDIDTITNDMLSLGCKSCNVVQYTKKEHVATALLKHGLCKSGIPASLGGSWGYYSHFRSFCRQQVMHEELLQAAVSGTLTKENATMIVEKEKLKKRKRELDVVYSRRRRQKVTSRKKGFYKSFHKLKVKNAKLRKENQRLEELHAKAMAAVVVEASSHNVPKIREPKSPTGVESTGCRKPAETRSTKQHTPMRPIPLAWTPPRAPTQFHTAPQVLPSDLFTSSATRASFSASYEDARLTRGRLQREFFQQPMVRARSAICPSIVSSRWVDQSIDAEIAELLALRETLRTFHSF